MPFFVSSPRFSASLCVKFLSLIRVYPCPSVVRNVPVFSRFTFHVSLMRLSEMRQILSDGDIKLTKSLGQNFLHDANQLKRIIDAAHLTKLDKVLEIGPGLGPLTEQLLEHACEVLAIEKDARLFQFLKKRFEPSIRASKLLLLHADALDYLQQKDRDWSGWKLVANLPYSVASPILVELAQSKRGPDQMVATLQLEVAKRLMAEP